MIDRQGPWFPRARSPWIILLGISAVFAGILTVHVGIPFLRHREVVCAFYANAARNHVRLGLGWTRGAAFEVAGPDFSVYDEPVRHVYTHRPPLAFLMTAAWFSLMGCKEWVLRLSLMVAALGTLWAFFFLARRFLPDSWSLGATALCAFNPMFLYFSVVAVHLVYALCFSVAGWACHVRANDSRRFRILSVVFLALACLSDWPGYFAVLAAAVDSAISRRWKTVVVMIGLALGMMALHLTHLAWIDGGRGILLRRFFEAGRVRSFLSGINLFHYVWGEGREAVVYFTLGGLALFFAGLGRAPRTVWVLSLFGLEEVAFPELARRHDFLTYSLVPFVALVAAHGMRRLGEGPRGRVAVVALLTLFVVQSVWIAGDRLTRFGAYEVNYQAGVAIRETASPREKTLITIADLRQYTPFYADRYTAGVEPWPPLRLQVSNAAGGEILGSMEDLARFLGDFDVVLVGDPEAAARNLRFFGGRLPPASFGFLGSDHPLRRRIEREAVSKSVRGAFLLYRMR